jgi:hypothetical protein
MVPKKTSPTIPFVIFGVVLLVAVVWLTHHRGATTHPAETLSPTVSATANPAVVTPASERLSGQLQQAAISLRAAQDEMSARQKLEQLRAALLAAPKDEAVAAIRAFLDSKADADTHLAFKVGQGGVLDGAPTLRTFLLDELGRLDPAAAADYSRIILQSEDSPDEWAVALRNLAWGDTSADGRSLLEQKTTELMQDAAWQQNPSTGYLEAFDVAVYLGGTSLIPTLTGLLQQPNDPAVTHASYLALDRMVINDPGATLNALLANPDLMQGRETTRADYFARADVEDPQQKQILENYLLSPNTSAAEINTFAGIFPNANYMLSLNLLTQSQTLTRASLAARDAASLQAVQQWLADPQFARLQPVLSQMETRISGYVQQEAQNH